MKSIKSFGDLGKLMGNTPTTSGPSGGSSDSQTTLVRRPERAGRAPYNFVPLAAQWKPVAPPPHLDSYMPDNEHRFSGEIDLRMEALTDFYIRGMHKLNDYEMSEAEEPSLEVSPFQVDGRLRLPGSSLRGMIRTLVEILGKAPMGPINDRQLFFRTVGSVGNPANRTSFEPHAAVYKQRIGGGDPLQVNGGLHVLPGYLYPGREEWEIHPAIEPDIYRVSIQDLKKSGLPSFWYRKCPISIKIEKGRRQVFLGGQDLGCLICSGPIPKKSKQWIILPEDKSARIPIPKADVDSYLESGEVAIHDPSLTKDSRAELERKFRYGKASGVPCFYVKWKDFDGGDHVSFGHTPFFRLPYHNTVANGIPATNLRGESDEWDIAQAIFGRVPNKALDKEARRGRVFFEDAVLIGEAPADFVSSETKAVVLGEPKPTTYQHYLVQPSEEVTDSIHWDGNYQLNPKVRPVIRGHKLYWHRPDAYIKSPRLEPSAAAPQRKTQGDVVSWFKRGLKGAVFSTRIRYENLSKVELGVLLTALALPEECAHKLGMGKPLGLGSFRLTLKTLRQINRISRYASFFASGDGTRRILNDGTQTGELGVASFLRAFAEWYGPVEKGLWSDPRLAELKAILTFDGLPADWSDRTRYLEFGRIPTYNDGRNYNEYTHVGHPDLKLPRLEKRRPLPPATQVLTDRRLPNDGRPPFKE